MYAILFDLEGTLIQSPTKNPDIISAYRSKLFNLFIKLGIPRAIVNISMPTSVAYNNALEFVGNNFSVMDVNAFHQEIDMFMTENEVGWAYQSKPFSDTHLVLNELKQSKLRIGLVTNTCKRAAEIMLYEGKLQNFFDAIVTRSDVTKLKPDPESTMLALNKLDSKRFFFIGDSESDALAAKAAGGTSVIIKSDLLKRTFNANYFVCSLSEISPFILHAIKP
jgi:HAD superfamily hydrolase (TIGR01549 family)